jgi:glycosyltransferase involved in cell wall biosynthesis
LIKLKHIAIVSSCIDDWGGSEELWGRAVPYLLEMNMHVTVYKPKINRNHPEYIALANKGVVLKDLLPEMPLAARVSRRSKEMIARGYHKLKLPGLQKTTPEPLTQHLKTDRPDLVIISQGINFDGLNFAYECAQLDIPYVAVAQKAVDFYWPQPGNRAMMIEALQNAKRCFFVSHHNHTLTEEQFGIRLSNAQVIYNPVKVSGNIVPYPSTENGYKLACIGRLFLLDKGQDILVRILSEKKWKDRSLNISFIGTGADEEGLKAMASLLHISNIEFTGQVNDIENLWKQYHAFILPSRSEGLPLSMIEAMAAGRPVIVSKAGGNAEIVEEGITGFMGHANEESFGDAMERAWHNRDEWEAMGRKASAKISATIPVSPEKEFAKHINEIINE